jgi:hypothetical protein
VPPDALPEFISLHAEIAAADTAESTTHAKNVQNRFMIYPSSKRTT